MNMQEFEANSLQELINELAEKNHKLLQDYYAEAQQVDIQKDEIARLKAKLEMYEKEPKKSYVEQIMELQDEVKALRSRLHWIWAIGVDYDGCGTVESLKELIDEMVDFTQMTDEEVVDTVYNKGAVDAATKIMHYLYPLWQDTTSKNVAIGSCLDWVKATFNI